MSPNIDENNHVSNGKIIFFEKKRRKYDTIHSWILLGIFVI